MPFLPNFFKILPYVFVEMISGLLVGGGVTRNQLYDWIPSKFFKIYFIAYDIVYKTTIISK